MTEYAKPIHRLARWDRGDIEAAALRFFTDVAGLTVTPEQIGIERVFRTYAVSVLIEDEDGRYPTAQPVRTPCCNAIDVIWGEYGDPEIEACSCPTCGATYTGEPF